MIIDLTEYEIKAILEVRAADVDPNRVGKEEYGDWLRLCARIEALAFKAQVKLTPPPVRLIRKSDDEP